ncbi:30S ribosomal protein S7 [Candidatus Saccharibacteria bacterium]|nr:30S ribosomal protein S7 [Candidatus Saccharibacteria bacterium]
MPRGGPVRKKLVEPDLRYGSTVVAKLINQVMEDGKKETARSLVYKAMDKASKSLEAEPLLVLTQALTNITPKQEVRSRRVGGATYQIPMPVAAERGQTLAIRWLVSSARSKKGKPFDERMAEELAAAYNGEGTAVKKKDDTHKMAEANRAFAHFRW